MIKKLNNDSLLHPHMLPDVVMKINEIIEYLNKKEAAEREVIEEELMRALGFFDKNAKQKGKKLNRLS